MNSNNKNTGWIPEEFYKKILKNIPIACVDLIITHGNYFLLGRRANEPAKDCWFFPGGRIKKGEKLINAAVRKTREEVGIDVNISDVSLLSVGETIYDALGLHTINTLFVIKIKEKTKIKNHDNQHNKFKWFSKINNSWPLYVKKFLKKAGFK